MMNSKRIAILVGTIIILSACQGQGNQANDTSTAQDMGRETVSTEAVFLNEDYRELSFDSRRYIQAGNEEESMYSDHYYLIPTTIRKFLGPGVLEQWAKQFQQSGGTRSNLDMTIVNIIKELDIPREALDNTGSMQTKEQLDAIYAKDQSEINRLFKGQNAFHINGQLYTPNWLATRTVSDYKQHDIPLAAVSAYLKTIEGAGPEVVSLNEEYRAIKSTLKKAQKITTGLKLEGLQVMSNLEIEGPYRTEYYGAPDFIHELVAPEVLEKWRNQFIYEAERDKLRRDIAEYNVVNMVRELRISKQDFIKANRDLIYSKEEIDAIYSGDHKQMIHVFSNEFALAIDNKLFSLDWMISNDVEDYKKAGISKDVLNAYIDKLRNNRLSAKQSGYIKLYEAHE